MTVDVTEGTQVILSSGVAAGEQVVVDGQEKLKNFSKVTPKDANAPAGGRQKGKGGANGTATGNGANGASTPAGAPAGTTIPGINRAGQQLPGPTPMVDSITGRAAMGPAIIRGSTTMSPSRPFILRPVATSLLMVAILLAGGVAYYQLPVSALPQVDYPTIQVMTFYPGASPEVMASSVTSPLERQFGQIPGLSQMTSTSSGGGSVITLQFSLTESIDVAQQDVQAAINASGSYLPKDLPNPPVYSKVNPADAPIMTLSLTSDTLQLTQVEDLADTLMAQKISQLSGVGLVSIAGGQKPAVRIQANPVQMASYGLSLEDLRTALGTANVDQAKGSLNGRSQAYTIGANDQLLSSKDYNQVIIAYRNGSPVRLSDVANAIDSAENLYQAAWMGTAAKPAPRTRMVSNNPRRM